MRFTSLPRVARAYILGVVVAAVGLVLAGGGMWPLTGGQNGISVLAASVAWDWPMFATLVIAAAVAHVFPVSSVEHRQAYHVSLPFFVAAAILLPPFALALLLVLVHVAEWVRRPQRTWFAQTFNLSAYILSATLARAIYSLVWAHPNAPIDLSEPMCLLAGALAVLVFGALNRGLVSGVIWLGNGIPPSRQQMLFERESLFTDGFLLAMGLPLARLGLDAPWALLLGAAPVLLIHRALDLPNIRAQGRRDPLTQLSTAAAIKDACSRELSRARHFGRPLALVVLEIGHFEQIVATHGRQAADILLRDAARLIEQAARAYDVPARLGRAQFGLLLPETDAAGARAMVEHARRTLTERGFDVASSIEQVNVTVRAGVAAVQSEAVTVDQLFEAAYASLDTSADAITHPRLVGVSDQHEGLPTAVARPTPTAAEAYAIGSTRPISVAAPASATTLQAQARVSRLGVLFVTSVTSLAAIVALRALPDLAGVDPLALGFLMALVAIGEVLSLQLFDRSAFSISVAPCLAAGMLFGVPGVIAAAPISALVRGVYRRTRWYKMLFNAGTYVISGAASAAIFQSVSPTLDPQGLPLLLVASALAGLAYYGHTGLVAAVMGIEARSNVAKVWLEHFSWLWPQYLVLSAMGLFLALGYAEFGMLGAAVFAIPPLMLRVVSKQYVDRTLANVRQLRELNDQLTHQAFHDPLTNLANRARLTDRVAQALGRAVRRQAEIVVLFIDLDNFKAVNDSLGHAAGDQLLVSVTDRLRACLRPVDTAARLGGDEFAVLLEEVEEAGEAIRVAQRILAQLQVPFVLIGKEVFVNASIGIALSRPGQTDADELLRNADVAMYAAKERGKGRYEVFESRLHAAVLRRLALEADLRTAVERQDLTVYYQPTIDLTNGQIAGFEALVRWDHPQRGMVPPGEFIASAEASGLIVPIGRWVLREACRQVRQWQTTYPGAERLTISVNLSARQLQEPTLVEDVVDALEDAGMDPAQLVLEITESLLMQETDVTVERLRALKALGVRLAIDDFGTGYSSLSYLRRFPFDILKIDRSFVSGVGDGSQDAVLTEAIVTLARTLRLTVVAEGIEQPEQLAFVRELRCDYGQGYYFARPLAVTDLEQLLARALPIMIGSGREPAGLMAAA